MWNFLASLIIFIVNWLSLLFGRNNQFPIISVCEKYTPNTNLSNQECSYGFSGRFCDECGLTFKRPNIKIIGGIEAEENSWPALAFILFRYKYPNKNKPSEIVTKEFLCGGSLIERQTVLTAAHCLVESFEDDFGNTIKVKVDALNPSFASMFTIYLGVHNNENTFTNDVNPPSIKVDVREFIMHPLYDSKTNINDIALIKLKEEIKPNCQIQFACLPTQDFKVKKITDSFAAGWGVFKNEEEKLPDLLQNVKLSLYPDLNYCKDSEPMLPDKQLCAGSLKTDVDTCQGDSGGPLYVREKVNGKDKFVLVGIVSYGPTPCASGSPGIYVKVSSYLDWIKEH